MHGWSIPVVVSTFGGPARVPLSVPTRSPGVKDPRLRFRRGQGVGHALSQLLALFLSSIYAFVFRESATEPPTSGFVVPFRQFNVPGRRDGWMKQRFARDPAKVPARPRPATGMVCNVRCTLFFSVVRGGLVALLWLFTSSEPPDPLCHSWLVVNRSSGSAFFPTPKPLFYPLPTHARGTDEIPRTRACTFFDGAWQAKPTPERRWGDWIPTPERAGPGAGSRKARPEPGRV